MGGCWILQGILVWACLFWWVGGKHPLPSLPTRSLPMLKEYYMCDVSVGVQEVSYVYSGLYTSRTRRTLLLYRSF